MGKAPAQASPDSHARYTREVVLACAISFRLTEEERRTLVRTSEPRGTNHHEEAKPTVEVPAASLEAHDREPRAPHRIERLTRRALRGRVHDPDRVAEGAEH